MQVVWILQVVSDLVKYDIKTDICHKDNYISSKLDKIQSATQPIRKTKEKNFTITRIKYAL